MHLGERCGIFTGQRKELVITDLGLWDVDRLFP